MSKYIQPKESGLFDKASRLKELHELGGPLARLDEVMDWTLVEAVFACLPKSEPKGPGGKPAFCPRMMFKVLAISNLYNLSDLQFEFPTTDRLSFKRFLRLTDSDQSTDEKMFSAFHEMLMLHELIEPLFAVFHPRLQLAEMSARKRQIVDASFVKVPLQRNSRGDNAATKTGEVPANWEDQPEKARQKDTDARWTSKNGERHYGYENDVKVYSRSKLIEAFTVTPASVHDSQALGELIADGDPTTYVASAYSGAGCDAIFAAHHVQAKPIERAYRNKPLKARQQSNNRARSRTRVRVEHVFATMRMSLRAGWNRCIGITRNRAAIGMNNLVYNLVRVEQIVRLNFKIWRSA